MSHLKVFSYNIHKGFGWGRKNYTLPRMREEIRKLAPDIVFLQEVHGRHAGRKIEISGWPSGSQFEYLAEEIWPHFSYGKNAIYTQGDHGNAILSRFPIRTWENTNISIGPFEKRGLLHVKLEVSNSSEPLEVFSVHLNLLEADRKKQILKIRDKIRSDVSPTAPIVIAGDFNDWNKNADALDLPEVFLSLRGQYAKTFPSFFPTLCLDRIYYRGLSPVEANCINDRSWASLSDHLPLSARFEMK